MTDNKIDLDNSDIQRQIAKAIVTGIDAYAVKAYDGGHREHLGASIIGDECARKIYYTFRWVKKSTFDGRMQRLFQRGHLEELRYIEYLRGMDFTVTDKDAQIKVSDCNGHFGGSLDGIVSFPATWGISGNFLVEYKTKGTGAGFNKLAEKGVRLTSPEHWAQQCVYGYKQNLTHSIYFSVNKNDDSIHCEFVKLDHGLGQDMIRKADRIINDPAPPEKYSQQVTNFKCRMCNFVGICHNGEPIEKNCRSCKFSRPVANAEWNCDKYNNIIPKDFIKTGCDSYEPVV